MKQYICTAIKLRTSMHFNCIHLITTKTKIIKPAGDTDATSFHCSLKRISRDDAKAINEAYQRQTQVSVAGYTCYYYNHKDLKGEDCPKFEEI